MPKLQAAQALPVSLPRRELLQRAGGTFFEDARSGQERFFAVSEILPGQVAVVGSWPVENAMSVSASPTSWMTLAFPVLMWIAGNSVAVLGLQQMVMRHLSKAEQRRERDLEEKTMLLREVHHRVKNNLKLVASIMNMQVRTAQTPEARRILSLPQRQVRGLATIHRGLNTNPGVATVDSRELIQELIAEIGTMNAGTGQDVVIETDLVQMPLSQDQGVTLSMLVSEAMTNAVKYIGRPEGGRPEIRVSLRETAENWLELELSNTKGQSLLHPEEEVAGTGIGARLMAVLATQLGRAARQAGIAPPTAICSGWSAHPTCSGFCCPGGNHLHLGALASGERRAESRMTSLVHPHYAPRVADHIDRNLKKAFDDLATDPLPERFTDLLGQLREAERHKKDIQ